MIPSIGLMIGAYIITRMVELLGNEGRLITKILSVITIIIAVLVIASLFSSPESSAVR